MVPTAVDEAGEVGEVGDVAVRRPAPAAGRLHLVAYGPPARGAVGAVLAEVKAADPLAPVTVVVPSALAGLSLRRALAAGVRGSVGVRVRSLPQLAAELGAPSLVAGGRRPLTPLRRGALVRAALAGGAGDGLGAVPGGATEAAVAATFAELGGAGARTLRALAATSARAAHVVAAFRRYREKAARWYDDADVIAAAAAAVRGGTPLRREVGHVVVHLPRRLSAAEVDLVAALAPGGLTAVVGRTGATDADEVALGLVERLAPVLGPPVVGDGPAVAPTGHRVVLAPDPEEEVRVAVRELVAWLAASPAHRAERVAIATRLSSPYDLLLTDALTTAGIAHHGPPARTLAQSVAGRTLLGLLALPDRRFARAEVMRWLRSAPVIDGDGRPVPAARWDRLSRQAGVAAGPEQWAARLAHLAGVLDRRAEEVAIWAAGDEAAVERVAADRDEVDRLAAFVADLAERAGPGDRRGWPELAGWAGTLLRHYLGGPARRSSWPAEEQAAADAVVGVLEELAALDGVEPGADAALLRRVLERALGAPVAGGGFGRGVLVARLADLAGVEVDRLVVLGMDDGRFPPKGGDDPLLPDRERRAAGADLPARAPTRGEEHRDLLAAMAGAEHITLSCARTDPRAQRRLLPAPWLLDTATALAGTPVRSADLGPLAGAGWLLHVPSFTSWLAGGGPPATTAEWELAALLAGHRPGEGVAGAAAVAAVPGLERGVAAAVARRRGEFSVWTGLVGPRPELSVTDGRPRSATALERWATCPFRYFLGDVLRVAGLDDPAEADTVGPLDRGALVHDVLEAVVRERAGTMRPGEPWGPADHARLRRVAEAARQRLEDAGRTGRPLLWRLEWSRLVRDLAVTLELDSRHRAAAGTAPVAVEHGFGVGDEPPVTVALDGDRHVVFRGRIDRVDATAGVTALEVIDYKSGSARGYEGLKAGDDPTGRGRHLQLGVYARAARDRWGDVPVDASYWFVSDKARFARLGGAVDAAADRRLEEVVGVVADGIGAGHFPARPGDDDGWFGPVHCRGCPYDRVCPSARGEQWERVRADRALGPFVALVEPDEGEDG